MMDEDVNALRKEMDNLIDKVYPVGSIYMSVSEVEPSILFGGEWEQIEDKFLLAAGTNHQNGSTGGSETHTLSESEMPQHKHDVATISNGSHFHDVNAKNVNVGTTSEIYGMTNNTPVGGFDTDYAGTHNHTINESDKGSSSAHNNMPPYLAVFMWKRSA